MDTYNGMSKSSIKKAIQVNQNVIICENAVLEKYKGNPEALYIINEAKANISYRREAIKTYRNILTQLS